MHTPNTPPDATAEQLDRLIETMKASDPVAADTFRVMEALFEALSPRPASPEHVSCTCGAPAVWDHQEKRFDCFACKRSWSA